MERANVGETDSRVSLHGAFELEVAPKDGIGLFTALGEREWVPGWDPTLIHPASGRLELDQVFTTDAGGEHTIWSVITLDLDTCRVEYSRVTPGSRVGRVSVRLEDCSTTDTNRSTVHVSYLFTALDPSAAPYLHSFADGFDSMLEQWQRLLRDHLRRR